MEINKKHRLTGSMIEVGVIHFISILGVIIFVMAIMFFFMTMNNTKESMTFMLMSGIGMSLAMIFATFYIFKNISLTRIEFDESKLHLTSFTRQYDIDIKRIKAIKRDPFGYCSLILFNEGGQVQKIKFMQGFFDTLDSFGGKSKHYRLLEKLITESQKKNKVNISK